MAPISGSGHFKLFAEDIQTHARTYAQSHIRRQARLLKMNRNSSINKTCLGITYVSSIFDSKFLYSLTINA